MENGVHHFSFNGPLGYLLSVGPMMWAVIAINIVLSALAALHWLALQYLHVRDSALCVRVCRRLGGSAAVASILSMALIAACLHLHRRGESEEDMDDSERAVRVSCVLKESAYGTRKASLRSSTAW